MGFIILHFLLHLSEKCFFLIAYIFQDLQLPFILHPSIHLTLFTSCHFMLHSSEKCFFLIAYIFQDLQLPSILHLSIHLTLFTSCHILPRSVSSSFPVYSRIYRFPLYFTLRFILHSPLALLLSTTFCLKACFANSKPTHIVFILACTPIHSSYTLH